ncbi:MAG: peptidase T [Clostridia bacterium]|nr:peptidase T [Clostridia bacterium]
MSVTERFLRYIQIPTPSDSSSTSYPSNPHETDLAGVLLQELKDMGVPDACIRDGVLYASIPSNCDPAPRHSIGFIAHMDTVSEPGQPQVHPRVCRDYNGGTLDVQREGDGISSEDFPQLKAYAGDTIICSDGTSVLGADDKAGIAEIMQMAEYVCTHPEYKHGKIGIAFTSDEELGRGTETFDVPFFGCDFAYTVDGEDEGEISYETFNAAAFTIRIRGRNCHPGSAKGVMINAVSVASDLISRLPAGERPETTEGKEGYYFFNRIKGNVDEATIEGIIRDHDRTRFEARKQLLLDAVQSLCETYPGRIQIRMEDEYYNCAEMILPHYHLIWNAEEAMEKAGIQPKIIPVRGGTDGSMLSYKGLPCPNLGTGGLGAHSLRECIPAGAMERMVRVLLDIISGYTEQK